jgi:glycosyltransferase involved in cell wall biosynthesis
MNMTWSFCICTYMRPDVLPRCIRLALAQTRQPAEIIIVDASPEWEASRAALTAEVRAAAPHIRCEYVKARRLSLPTQRNQALDLARSDILFFFDDDSLMFPDCAEKILRVYEADADGRILAVGATLDDRIPDDPGGVPSATAAVAAPRRGLLAKLVQLSQRLVYIEHFWVPYDADFPSHAIPEGVLPANVIPTHWIGGMRMTFRREAIAACRFAEVLEAYAYDDLDATYRVSRLGPIVNALDARLHHLVAPGGRLPRGVVAHLAALNAVALHVLYSSDLRRSARRLRRVFLRYACLYAAIDPVRGRWSLPVARGYLRALRQMGRLLRLDADEIQRIYPAYQRAIIDGARPRPTAC